MIFSDSEAKSEMNPLMEDVGLVRIFSTEFPAIFSHYCCGFVMR
jgi:hypothetical protein